MTDIALKAQEDLLSFDVSDDALEAAAGAARIGAQALPLVLARACLSAPADLLKIDLTAFLERPPRGGLSVLAKVRFFGP